MCKGKKGFIDIVDVVSIIVIAIFLIGFFVVFGFYDSWSDFFGSAEDEKIEALKVNSKTGGALAFLQMSFDTEKTVSELIVESFVNEDYADFENFVKEKFVGDSIYWYFAFYDGDSDKPVKVFTRANWIPKGVFGKHAEYKIPTFEGDFLRIKMRITEGVELTLNTVII